jgi:hypothetical protein
MRTGHKPRLALPLSSPFLLQAAASGVTVFPDVDPEAAQAHTCAAFARVDGYF